MLSNEFGTTRTLRINERISSPGPDCSDGKFETPQLFEIISARGFPSNVHLSSMLSNPAAHNQEYTVSPNHNAFTGIIFAPGATPLILYLLVLL